MCHQQVLPGSVPTILVATDTVIGIKILVMSHQVQHSKSKVTLVEQERKQGGRGWIDGLQFGNSQRALEIMENWQKLLPIVYVHERHYRVCLVGINKTLFDLTLYLKTMFGTCLCFPCYTRYDKRRCSIWITSKSISEISVFQLWSQVGAHADMTFDVARIKTNSQNQNKRHLSGKIPPQIEHFPNTDLIIWVPNGHS